MSEPPPYDGGGLSCIPTTCGSSHDPCLFCYLPDPLLSPPPPPPPLPPPHSASSASSATHLAPYLIATVCILAISFLFLTTCTIILRCRFSPRRRRRSTSPDDTAVDDVGGGVDHHIWHIATVGLSQSVIDSIDLIKYRKLDGLVVDESDCIVCLSEFEDGEELRLLPKCSHAFHVSCIDAWLRSHTNCPICRAPVVNEGFDATGGINSESVRVDMPIRGDGGGVDSDDNGDDVGELRMAVEGIKIAEILRKNREQLRIFSDLAENYRFRRDEECVGGDESVRRSVSFDVGAASSIARAIGKENEGCSSSGDGNQNAESGVVQEKKMEVEKVKNKRGSSMSGLLLMKSSSIGRSLQKGPVSMKRSISSGGKLFSFRKTKSQASILPL